jgi:aryl-alcohol dehydrogenase-like predicted oxidoreductase
VLTTPGVTATVIGASSVEQLEQAISYADKPLDRAAMGAIDAAYAFRPSKGHGG